MTDKKPSHFSKFKGGKLVFLIWTMTLVMIGINLSFLKTTPVEIVALHGIIGWAWLSVIYWMFWRYGV